MVHQNKYCQHTQRYNILVKTMLDELVDSNCMRCATGSITRTTSKDGSETMMTDCSILIKMDTAGVWQRTRPPWLQCTCLLTSCSWAPFSAVVMGGNLGCQVDSLNEIPGKRFWESKCVQHGMDYTSQWMPIALRQMGASMSAEAV